MNKQCNSLSIFRYYHQMLSLSVDAVSCRLVCVSYFCCNYKLLFDFSGGHYECRIEPDVAKVISYEVRVCVATVHLKIIVSGVSQRFRAVKAMLGGVVGRLTLRTSSETWASGFEARWQTALWLAPAPSAWKRWLTERHILLASKNGRPEQPIAVGGVRFWWPLFVAG